MSAKLTSYIEAAKAWLDGETIQYSTRYGKWVDWDGAEPYYNGEDWRPKPVKYVWIRVYLEEDDTFGLAHNVNRNNLLGSDRNWLDEPRLVKVPA